MNAAVLEVHVKKVHLEEQLLIEAGPQPHIDPVRWCPLIISFCRFFGLGDELRPSRLAQLDFMKVMHGQAPGGR